MSWDTLLWLKVREWFLASFKLLYRKRKILRNQHIAKTKQGHLD